MGILVGLFFDFSFKVVLFLEFNIYGFEVVLCDVNLMRFFIVILEILLFILLVMKKRNWLSICGVICVCRELNIDVLYMRVVICCILMLIINVGIF